MFKEFEFAYPEYFYLLLIIPLMIAWYWFKNHRAKAEIKLSTTLPFAAAKRSYKQYLYHLLFVIRIVAVAALVIAMARPQSTSSSQDVSIEGIDIVIALDISGSMLAEDFRPNRIEAAKELAIEFIGGRPGDRIGLVVFAGEAFTQVPLTTDHRVLGEMFRKIETGMIEDGTAIGDGLATAVARLLESSAVSKVIILLTDGVNNMGAVDPLSAAEIAKMEKIRVYSVGIGTLGTAPYPVQTPFGVRMQNVPVEIDENLLQNISSETNGKYFRATSNTKLREIYNEIDQLEKSKIDVTEFYKKQEEFLPFALIALLLFVIELLLKYTFFRTTP
ncbi:MAG: VWA domain-containing protein [Sphingobacteriia bacterium]|nr:VWA domain-containing protein [Sphingobacteriia bacterium]